jgi:2-dehydropantoate 2-reductase
MRILVVGAGATGGYFGARLHQAGRNVTFLVRPSRAALLRAKGLTIQSPSGETTLNPPLVSADAIKTSYDVVLLTVKAFSLEAALADLRPAVGPQTMILPVLNGMKHVELIRQEFGEEALVGCVCKIATFLDDEGRIVQLSPLHDLAYGEMDGSLSERVTRLDQTMQGAGFDAKLSADVEREMWEKWILLATLGGVTCLMRGTIGDIEAVPDGAGFSTAFLDEVISVVRSVGRAPSEAFVASARDALTKRGSPLTSSMYRDLQAGHPVEVEQIISDLLRRGQAAGISTPLLSVANIHLSVYQRRIDV